MTPEQQKECEKCKHVKVAVTKDGFGFLACELRHFKWVATLPECPLHWKIGEEK